MRRRRPPYAQRLADLLADRSAWPRYNGTSADGQRLTVRVVAGADAWTVAREWTPIRPYVPFLVAPPGEDPATFSWRQVADHGLVMICPAGAWSRDDEIRLVTALLRAGADGVLVLGHRSQLYRAAGRELAHG